MLTNFTINQLASFDLYLGFSTRNWNTLINFFLLGKYRNINVFNLNYTLVLLRQSFKLLNSTLSKSGTIWVLNDGPFEIDRIPEFLILNRYYNNTIFLKNKWEKGLLTNYKQMYKRVFKFRKLRFPNILFSLSIDNNFYSINEGFILNLPTISLVDSRENPLNVLYPIPGNTKSLNSVFSIYNLIFRSALFSNALKKNNFLKNIKSSLLNRSVCLSLFKHFDFLNNNIGNRYKNSKTLLVTYLESYLFETFAISAYFSFLFFINETSLFSLIDDKTIKSRFESFVLKNRTEYLSKSYNNKSLLKKLSKKFLINQKINKVESGNYFDIAFFISKQLNKALASSNPLSGKLLCFENIRGSAYNKKAFNTSLFYYFVSLFKKVC